jgi:hypothetical protein
MSPRPATCTVLLAYDMKDIADWKVANPVLADTIVEATPESIERVLLGRHVTAFTTTDLLVDHPRYEAALARVNQAVRRGLRGIVLAERSELAEPHRFIASAPHSARS